MAAVVWERLWNMPVRGMQSAGIGVTPAPAVTADGSTKPFTALPKLCGEGWLWPLVMGQLWTWRDVEESCSMHSCAQLGLEEDFSRCGGTKP